MDHSHKGSLINCINSKMELIRLLDDWRMRCAAGDFVIPLSKEGQRALSNALDTFHQHILASPNVPLHLDPGMTYHVEVYFDGIILRLDRLDEGHADLNGCPDTTGDFRRIALLDVPIPAIPLQDWLEQYGVDRGAALSWIASERIFAFDGGTDYFVSSIQYPPDADPLSSNNKLRFPKPGILPAMISDKYPALAGDLAGIGLLHDEDTHSFHVMVFPRHEDSEFSTPCLYPLTFEEYSDMIDMLHQAHVKSVVIQDFRCPLGEFGSGVL